jgi:hypothetical protein
MPLICAQPPRNTWDLAMWPSGLGGGAARGNSGEVVAGEGREGKESGPGVTGARFGYLLAAGRGPAGGYDGRRRRWPLEALLRQG